MSNAHHHYDLNWDCVSIDKRLKSVEADRDRLEAENEKLKKEIQMLSCPLCGNDVDGKNYKAENARLREAFEKIKEKSWQDPWVNSIAQSALRASEAVEGK